MIASHLTVRTAADHIYIPASPGIASRTRRKLQHQWNCWEKHTSNPTIHTISVQTFAAFRAACLAANLSPVTIENVVSDVLTVLRCCVEQGYLKQLPMPGRRLRKLPQPKDTPTVQQFCDAYNRCQLTTWPKDCDSASWWRGLLALAYFSALRRDDLLTLRWSEISGGRITRKLRKTGRVHVVPVHGTLAATLETIPKQTEEVFGRSTSLHQIRREMQTLFQTDKFTLQSLRRMAARQWESARTGCGALILGHAYRGALGSYLDPLTSLEKAVLSLEVPECFGVAEPHRDERRLLQAFRRLNARDAAAVVSMAESLD